MNSIYGWGMNNSFMDTFFGTSSSSSTSSSLFSSLGDMKMIQSGVYKKALQAYYAKKTSSTEKESVKNSGTADSTVSLSNLKTSAKKLYEAANKLKTSDYSGTAEDLLEDAKEFVNQYNNTLNTTKNMNSYSILQTAVWGTERMNISEGLLNKVGITIGETNTLSMDEDKFKEASMSDLKALFSGSGSLADYIAGKASTLCNQSANQLAINQGKTTYTMYGTLI